MSRYNANGEDTEFEDWSWTEPHERLHLPRARLSLRRAGVVFLVLAIACLLFWGAFQGGAIVAHAWVARFG